MPPNLSELFKLGKFYPVYLYYIREFSKIISLLR